MRVSRESSYEGHVAESSREERAESREQNAERKDLHLLHLVVEALGDRALRRARGA
jgi:hypothetical protein